jgi:phage recombination protein Bet
MNAQTVRSRAIAKQDEQIAANVAKIEAAKARPSALEALAGKLNVSPGALTTTLKSTVFKGASNEEFVALVIVSNAYGLNPLLKEIFAFPAKGGGIIPVVSVDGWIRIINEHPQFDGIEFNDIVDEDGKLYAIESVIYRRDRTRPIKVTEYMDECKGQGPAWQKTPKRMLRHRALIQGGRVAFGFSGIYAEDDADTVVGTVQQDGGHDARNVTYPTRQQVITHDIETGEIVDDEESARALDAQTSGWQDGPADEQRGERLTLDQAMAEIDRCATVIDVNAKLEALCADLSEEDGDELHVHAGIRKNELGAKA